MKATSLSISLPIDKKCNKNCGYCISKMTDSVLCDRKSFYRNINKVKNVASNCGVNCVIITGKSEPLLAMEQVKKVARIFKDFPLEIQTNGILLNKRTLSKLKKWGINTVAVSIDNYKDYKSFLEKAYKLHDPTINFRITMNLLDRLYENLPKLEILENNEFITTDKIDFERLITNCREMGIPQISFREVTIPKKLLQYEIEQPLFPFLREISQEKKEAMSYIRKNTDEEKVKKIVEDFNEFCKEKGELVAELGFGAKIYETLGVTTTLFDYCIQDSSGEEDIRSLVYFEDGHLSRSWNGSNSGRIL